MTSVSPLKPWTEWTVAITGMNARPENPGPGIAVARCIREAAGFNGQIVGLGYDALDAGLHHREFCDRGYLMGFPSEGQEIFAHRLIEIIEEARIDAIIPCLDSELLIFANLADELARRGIRTMVPNRVQLRARDKDRLPELCASIGMATPDCHRATEASFFDRCEDHGLTYPLVVKGVFYDAHIVHDAAQAKRSFEMLAANWGYPVLVQPFVQGQEFNLTAIGDGAGGMVGAVSMRKRAVTDKGKAWAGITILDPGLEEAATRLIAQLKWRGPLEIETLRAEDGTLYLIEINPRFPAWTYLTTGVGRNLPVLLLQLLSGVPPMTLPPQRAGALFIRHAQELVIGIDDLAAISTTGATQLGDQTARLRRLQAT